MKHKPGYIHESTLNALMHACIVSGALSAYLKRTGHYRLTPRTRSRNSTKCACGRKKQRDSLQCLKCYNHERALDRRVRRRKKRGAPKRRVQIALTPNPCHARNEFRRER